MTSSTIADIETLRTPKRAAAAALVGTSIEWYDFFIYATAAALVFREVFFDPNLPPLLCLIVAFGTTSFGYLGRPVGALMFGSLGDKIGRKRTLVITLLLMGTATFCMDVLPTYATVGALAPILLITLRFLQGVAVGGEWGGAAMLSVEHAPPERRTFLGSFTQMGSSVGALFSSLLFLSTHSGSGALIIGMCVLYSRRFGAPRRVAAERPPSEARGANTPALGRGGARCASGLSFTAR